MSVMSSDQGADLALALRRIVESTPGDGPVVVDRGLAEGIIAVLQPFDDADPRDLPDLSKREALLVKILADHGRGYMRIAAIRREMERRSVFMSKDTLMVTKRRLLVKLLGINEQRRERNEELPESKRLPYFYIVSLHGVGYSLRASDKFLTEEELKTYDWSAA